MSEDRKITAVKKAIHEHADYAAMDCAVGFLWSEVDNVAFSEKDKIARARWKAKIVFDAPEEGDIESTSLPEKVIYEENTVEVHRLGEGDEPLSYFVNDWDADCGTGVWTDLSWDDEKITQEDVDVFCQWQDMDILREELIERFGAKEKVNLDLFPMKLRPLISKCLAD